LLNHIRMQLLSLSEMEQIHGGWQSTACKIGFGVVGALVGGAVGAVAFGTLGNILCYPSKAQ
jgi:O-antigen/teichoic acid export membrane protein